MNSDFVIEISKMGDNLVKEQKWCKGSLYYVEFTNTQANSAFATYLGGNSLKSMVAWMIKKFITAELN